MQSQRLVKDGNTLGSAEDNLSELTSQAQAFADKHLSILKALQIVDADPILTTCAD
jgi:hypothetical protein